VISRGAPPASPAATRSRGARSDWRLGTRYAVSSQSSLGPCGLTLPQVLLLRSNTRGPESDLFSPSGRENPFGAAGAGCRRLTLWANRRRARGCAPHAARNIRTLPNQKSRDALCFGWGPRALKFLTRGMAPPLCIGTPFSLSYPCEFGMVSQWCAFIVDPQIMGGDAFDF